MIVITQMLYFYIKFILNLKYVINYSKKTEYLSTIIFIPNHTYIIYFQTNEYNFSEIVIISDKNKMNFSEPIKLHNSQVRPIRIEYLVSV